MSELSRRTALRSIAVSATLGTRLSAEAAQHVHRTVADEKKPAGAYKPKAFTAQEYHTLEILAELIVPGARKGGAPEFIDLLASNNAELAAGFTGGIAWLDRQMERRHEKAFADCTPEQQTAMLDQIAYRENDAPDLAPGVRFFELARRMTVDAYYTSKAGIEELGYMGNQGMAKFEVPKEAIEYAVKKSGL